MRLAVNVTCSYIHALGGVCGFLAIFQAPPRTFLCLGLASMVLKILYVPTRELYDVEVRLVLYRYFAGAVKHRRLAIRPGVTDGPMRPSPLYFLP